MISFEHDLSLRPIRPWMAIHRLRPGVSKPMADTGVSRKTARLSDRSFLAVSISLFYRIMAHGCTNLMILPFTFYHFLSKNVAKCGRE